MLAAVAAEIVVSDGLPAAAEYTWFQKFSLMSMTFAFIALIESVVSIIRCSVYGHLLVGTNLTLFHSSRLCCTFTINAQKI